MVANPEISRLNGAKSRGPLTERGKAIAAHNATKHGLLSTKPPLVLGEDLETFQGIVQGLIDEYQPQTPTEQLLIQQVAMGWLRLHRLWGAEAAIASITMLQLESQAKYPTTSVLDSALAELTTMQEKQPHSISVLNAEGRVAQELQNTVEEWLYKLPKPGLKQWLVSQEGQATVAQLLRILDEFRGKLPIESIPAQDSAQFSSSLCSKLIYATVCLEFWLGSKLGVTGSVGKLREIAQAVIDGCRRRIDEIDITVADQERLDQAEQQAAIASQAIIPEPEKLSRYERHINRTLYQALDKLELVRQQRRQAGSIGSFGRTTATLLTNANNYGIGNREA